MIVYFNSKEYPVNIQNFNISQTDDITLIEITGNLLFDINDLSDKKIKCFLDTETFFELILRRYFIIDNKIILIGGNEDEIVY